MFKFRQILISIVIIPLYSSTLASPEPADPAKQTPWGLYVDSAEVFQMKQEQGEKMLFIDVRDPIEIMFTGFTDVIDINIPYKLANRHEWNSKKPVYAMEINPHFEKQISSALEERSLTKDAPVVLMCRSGGTRGAPSAKALWGKGYTRVYVVTDGFEGGKIKSGDNKNWRLKNGWKNSDLPWSYKLNKEKMHIPAKS